MYATSPSYTDVHDRWIEYQQTQLDIAAYAVKTWLWSLDRLTWQFYHDQIQLQVSRVEKIESHCKISLYHCKISK